MNYVNFNTFYLLTLLIFGQKLVDSSDSAGLIWTQLGLFNELRKFQHSLLADLTGLIWTRLDSSGLYFEYLILLADSVEIA